MMKEDRNPLRYMTNGMVAINFCWSQKEEQDEETATAVTWPLEQQRLLPCGGPECWWGTWTCTSGTGWRLAWWACRAWPPAAQSPVHQFRHHNLSGKTGASPLLPGRKRAVAASTSTAWATAAFGIWGAGAYSHSAPHPPLLPPLCASLPLLSVYSLWYPSGRRRRRQHQAPIRSMLGSMVNTHMCRVQHDVDM